MKNIILILMFLVGVTEGSARKPAVLPKEKTAILMVHFGTTFDQTRAATIDAINEKAQTGFPEVKVAEAYTSRIVINRLAERGIVKLTPKEALLRLAADGFTHVIVQGTNVIDGIEAEVLRNEAALMAPFFTEIRVGRPLLYSVEDCRRVVKALQDRYAASLGKKTSVVFVGHGTSTPATATYSQTDYMFASMGTPRAHVATIEGYPTYETVLERLKRENAKEVVLVPFMFVAGDHARNDIDGEWRERLEKEGFRVEAVMEGLGQLPAVQDLYIEHVREAFDAPVLDAATQKSNYIKENL